MAGQNGPSPCYEPGRCLLWSACGTDGLACTLHGRRYRHVGAGPPHRGTLHEVGTQFASCRWRPHRWLVTRHGHWGIGPSTTDIGHGSSAGCTGGVLVAARFSPPLYWVHGRTVPGHAGPSPCHGPGRCYLRSVVLAYRRVSLGASFSFVTACHRARLARFLVPPLPPRIIGYDWQSRPSFSTPPPRAALADFNDTNV